MSLHLGARAFYPQIFRAEIEGIAIVECNRQELAVFVQPQLRRPGIGRPVGHRFLASTHYIWSSYMVLAENRCPSEAAAAGLNPVGRSNHFNDLPEIEEGPPFPLSVECPR